MKYRTVLLDRSFLQALRAEHDPDHEAAKTLFWQLVDTYVAGSDQLFALSTVLAELPDEFRKAALAPVLTLHVARQHLTAAATITEVAPDDALTLVMMQRHRIRAVATTRNVWDAFEIEVLKPVADDSGLNSRTEPTPAQRSTAE